MASDCSVLAKLDLDQTDSCMFGTGHNAKCYLFSGLALAVSSPALHHVCLLILLLCQWCRDRGVQPQARLSKG